MLHIYIFKLTCLDLSEPARVHVVPVMRIYVCKCNVTGKRKADSNNPPRYPHYIRSWDITREPNYVISLSASVRWGGGFILAIRAYWGLGREQVNVVIEFGKCWIVVSMACMLELEPEVLIVQYKGIQMDSVLDSWGAIRSALSNLWYYSGYLPMLGWIVIHHIIVHGRCEYWMTDMHGE